MLAGLTGCQRNYLPDSYGRCLLFVGSLVSFSCRDSATHKVHSQVETGMIAISEE